MIWVPERARAGRVFVRALAAGTGGGGLLGLLTVSALYLAEGAAPWTSPAFSLVGSVIGAAVGVPVAVVVGGVLALCQGRSRDGLDRAQAACVAGLAAGLPLLLVFGARALGSPRVIAGIVLPIVLATAAFAAAVAPVLVRPRWRAVSARPTDAAAAAGTASPGWSRAPGR